MAEVRLERITKQYGQHRVVDEVSLDIADGEFLVLLGPSGCGKTTTLRMIAGLATPTSGSIRIGGADVTATPVRLRNIGMIFQDYALFPHMTVGENIAFGLTERRQPRKQVEARVRELLELIRLPGYEARYPEQLSGGQQQRVALARALAYSPALLLMDEPLGALDLKLREAMQIELHRLQRELRVTTILVTHDQEEAMSLADRIAIMAEGQVQQVGAPEELYHSPANAFVAQFVGKVNLLSGTLTALSSGVASVRLQDGSLVNAFAREPLALERASPGLRPTRKAPAGTRSHRWRDHRHRAAPPLPRQHRPLFRTCAVGPGSASGAQRRRRAASHPAPTSASTGKLKTRSSSGAATPRQWKRRASPGGCSSGRRCW